MQKYIDAVMEALRGCFREMDEQFREQQRIEQERQKILNYMALLIRNRAYINMFYALGIAARAFIRTAWIKRNANTGRSRSSSVSDIMLVTMPVPPTTLNASQILVCGIPSDYYMETCLEGYGTFFFDRRVLMDAYDRCREVCGYEG